MYQVIIERPRGGAGWGRDWPRFDWRQAAAFADQTQAAEQGIADRDAEEWGEASGPVALRVYGYADGGPRKLRMGPRSRSKWLSENLAPLRRFLLRRLGRPWNDVHSEICAQIGLRSAVQKHVLDHLRHYVELYPVMIDGYPHHRTAGSRIPGGVVPLSDYGRSFYVCPDTGTLQLAGHPRRRKTADATAARTERQ